MGLFNKDIKDVKDIKQDNESKPQVKKRLYLVDYENVSDAGIVGIDELSSADCVIVFYGSKIKTVAYESLIAITKSKATIEHLKAEKTAKNYLDFQLTTYLGYKLGTNHFDEIYVISKDSGFDAVVDFWTDKGYVIKRQTSIVLKETINKEVAPKIAASPKTQKATAKSNVTPAPAKKTANTKSSVSNKKQNAPKKNDKTRSELRAALKECNLTAPEYKKVYDAFDKSTTELQYNNLLQKKFGSDRTKIIYKATNKVFEKHQKA